MSVPKEIAQDLVKNKLNVPTVFKGMIDGWSCRNWTLDDWLERLKKKTVETRVGITKAGKEPMWEGDCAHISPVGKHLRALLKHTNHAEDGRWFYADYKYMSKLFEDDQEVLKMIDWSVFGFENRDGADSTIWIGSEGAHTPCHFDAYGYNIVSQLCGKKRWTLFSPDQTDFLKPTRIPYEESSTFSSLNLLNPNLLKDHPSFQNTTPYVVVLEPGDCLFVPHQWWHFVESLELSVSINTWVEQEVDDDCRLEEAITKTVINTFCEFFDVNNWRSPTEECTSRATNFMYIEAALEQLKKRKRCVSNEDDEDGPTVKRQRFETQGDAVIPDECKDYIRMLTPIASADYARTIPVISSVDSVDKSSRTVSPVPESSEAIVPETTGAVVESLELIAAERSDVVTESLKIIAEETDVVTECSEVVVAEETDVVTECSEVVVAEEADSVSESSETGDPENVGAVAGSSGTIVPGKIAAADDSSYSEMYESYDESCDESCSETAPNEELVKLLVNSLVHPHIVSKVAELLKNSY